MKKLSLVATLALTLMGCQPDPQQGKIDQLAKDVAEIKQLLKSGAGAGAGAATGAAGANAAAAAAAAAAKPQPPRRVADPSKTYAFNIEGLPTVGSSDAKITVVKAYEYMCPYCEKVNPTIEQLKAKYGKDIRFAYSQRIIHPGAGDPAVAGRVRRHQAGQVQRDGQEAVGGV
jgi:protein-disulfide isomerase